MSIEIDRARLIAALAESGYERIGYLRSKPEQREFEIWRRDEDRDILIEGTSVYIEEPDLTMSIALIRGAIFPEFPPVKS